ncbi:MAG: AAA family ATPase [Alcanivorax sp.]|uniref:AAA family ATPase n=1 Tax=Alcanivorax sp. TaxID=1872427 RepID=UPI0032D8D2D0
METTAKKNRITPRQTARNIIDLWVARTLSSPGVWEHCICPFSERFEKPLTLDQLDINSPEIQKRKTIHPVIKKIAQSGDVSSLLKKDRAYIAFSTLSESLGLNENEVRTLTLIYHNDTNIVVEDIVEISQKFIPEKQYIPFFLDISKEEFRHCLRRSGLLRKAKLIKVFSHLTKRNIVKSASLDEQLMEVMASPCDEDISLSDLFYQISCQSTLEESDYSHAKKDYGIAKAIINDALSQQKKGVNILVYGPPGTGKTQLAHLVSKSLGAKLAVIPQLDNDGHAISPHRRLGRFHACQMALSNKEESIVLFDEVEDIIIPSPLHFDNIPKGALVHTLEDNGTPSIWITNKNLGIDPAIQRRFAHIIHLDTPGKPQRSKIIDDSLQGAPVSTRFRELLAEIDDLPPSIIATLPYLAKVSLKSGFDAEETLAHALNTRLENLGSRNRLDMTDKPTLSWQPECLQASMDVNAIMDELSPYADARFCLSGPPGTGKTSWARQIAIKLERPLISIQASSLLSPYVGETEGNIAKVFKQAERDNAVLLVDEIDSFLSNREHARQNWEISHVNQFLTSLERHRGIFLATTNLKSRMDPASARRFDFHIHFDYLNHNGIILLLEELAKIHSIALPDHEQLKASLQCLNQLTPGDFSVIDRSIRVRQKQPKVEDLIVRLKEINDAKSETRQPIGFIH